MRGNFEKGGAYPINVTPTVAGKYCIKNVQTGEVLHSDVGSASEASRLQEQERQALHAKVMAARECPTCA